jgi:hypothetical protein
VRAAEAAEDDPQPVAEVDPEVDEGDGGLAGHEEPAKLSGGTGRRPVPGGNGDIPK